VKAARALHPEALIIKNTQMVGKKYLETNRRIKKMPINLTTSNIQQKFDELFTKENTNKTFLNSLTDFIDYYHSHDVVQKAILKLTDDPVYIIYVKAQELYNRNLERQSSQHIRLANIRRTYK
jgi:hypothetical protein